MNKPFCTAQQMYIGQKIGLCGEGLDRGFRRVIVLLNLPSGAFWAKSFIDLVFVTGYFMSRVYQIYSSGK